MKKIVLTFGLLSGGIVAMLMNVLMVLCLNGRMDMQNSEILGYTIMVLAFILVYFGIRSYRENVSDGRITFGRAFKVGILITLITCVVYVVVWEVVYFNFIPDFADRYTAMSLQKLRASGASDVEILKHQQDMVQFKKLYANIFVNIGMTFMEIFPVGLLVTLISAAILRKPAATAAVVA